MTPFFPSFIWQIKTLSMGSKDWENPGSFNQEKALRSSFSNGDITPELVEAGAVGQGISTGGDILQKINPA